jgi:hypothetical protein
MRVRIGLVDGKKRDLSGKPELGGIGVWKNEMTKSCFPDCNKSKVGREAIRDLKKKGPKKKIIRKMNSTLDRASIIPLEARFIVLITSSTMNEATRGPEQVSKLTIEYLRPCTTRNRPRSESKPHEILQT